MSEAVLPPLMATRSATHIVMLRPASLCYIFRGGPPDGAIQIYYPEPAFSGHADPVPCREPSDSAPFTERHINVTMMVPQKTWSGALGTWRTVEWPQSEGRTAMPTV
jgi:hypothetical protein